MPLFHVVILAVVQGATEFLPISSSAHLVLARDLLSGPSAPGAGQQALAFDIAVHVGTLFAVILYFRADVAAALRGAFTLLRGRRNTADARLAFNLLVATVPVVIVGYVGRDFIATSLRGTEVIAWATIVFALVLFAADRLFGARRGMADLAPSGAVLIGLSQVLALIPGTSRSGITMTAARALGLDRPAAARFSMLMSIPVIVAGGALLGLDAVRGGAFAVGADALIGAVVACLTALAAIALLMRWLERASFLPFVLYRLALGLVLLAWIYAS